MDITELNAHQYHAADIAVHWIMNLSTVQCMQQKINQVTNVPIVKNIRRNPMVIPVIGTSAPHSLQFKRK